MVVPSMPLLSSLHATARAPQKANRKYLTPTPFQASDRTRHRSVLVKATAADGAAHAVADSTNRVTTGLAPRRDSTTGVGSERQHDERRRAASSQANDARSAQTWIEDPECVSRVLLDRESRVPHSSRNPTAAID